MHFTLRHFFLPSYNVNKSLRLNTDIYLGGTIPYLKGDENVLPQCQFIAVTINYSTTNRTNKEGMMPSNEAPMCHYLVIL